MYVSKEMRFEAAHRLPDYDGACRNIHGHSYRVEIEIERDVDAESGMAMDFKDLSLAMSEWVNLNWDHAIILKYRDDFVRPLHGRTKMYLMPGAPTAENMCHELWDAMEATGLNVSQICLWETETSCATLTSEDRPEKPEPEPMTLYERLYASSPGIFTL